MPKFGSPKSTQKKSQTHTYDPSIAVNKKSRWRVKIFNKGCPMTSTLWQKCVHTYKPTHIYVSIQDLAACVTSALIASSTLALNRDAKVPLRDKFLPLLFSLSAVPLKRQMSLYLSLPFSLPSLPFLPILPSLPPIKIPT